MIIMEHDNINKIHTTVEVLEGGPLKITGKILLKDLKRDKVENLDEVMLCRCGRSGNKPFCDDSHKR